MLAGTVLTLEFLFDIGSDEIWRRIVIAIDIVLVVGFASYLAQGALRARGRLIFWVMAEKINLLIMVAILAVLYIPRLAAAILICRLLVGFFVRIFDTEMGRRFVTQINLRPSQTLALSFIATILVGTVLLTFPAATMDGKGANFLDALFTITSATCVTGLSVVDIGSYFSRFGQTVILVAIQIGGLGIMVLSASFAVLVGGHLPTRRQAGLSEILDVRTTQGVKSLLQAVAAATFIFEFFGATCLFIVWRDDIPKFGDRLWWSVFHSVSAFCNCGFGLAPDSLVRWVSDPFVCGIMGALITFGGIGFFVIADVMNSRVWQVLKPRAIWDRLHTQTKVVILATIFLNTMGMLLFLFLEYDGALKGLSVGGKIIASLFQAIALRTAGFSSVSYALLTVPTVLMCILWMFIGASPGSTGGGIKTTTAAIAVAAIRSMLRGRDDVEILNRRMSPAIVARSLSIVLIGGMVVLLFSMLLAGTQHIAFDKLLFEVVSAFGTVGLSMDITPQLDNVGRILIILLMYIGRIGPLTLALAIGERETRKGFRLPAGRIAVG